MAKEFDIYLREHLVECDLLVYSIPYHDGISVTNRLILEAALNSYLLHQFAAVQMGSEVEAHIDKMIKLCSEKLRMGVKLGVTADFETQARLYLENDPVILDAPAVDLLEQIFNEVESGLVLAVKPLVTQVALSTGTGDFPLPVDAKVTGTIMHSLLNLKGATMMDAAIMQINQADHVSADMPVDVDSAVRNLCYRLPSAGRTALEIVALVLGTEMRHSLGVWYNGITVNSKVKGTTAQKFIIAETVTAIMQEAVGKLTKVLYPNEASMLIRVPNVVTSMKRYRLLSELDDLTLAELDNRTLGELDYVWLPDE